MGKNRCQVCDGPIEKGRCKLCGMPYRNDETRYCLNENQREHYRHGAPENNSEPEFHGESKPHMEPKRYGKPEARQTVEKSTGNPEKNKTEYKVNNQRTGYKKADKVSYQKSYQKLKDAADAKKGKPSWVIIIVFIWLIANGFFFAKDTIEESTQETMSVSEEMYALEELPGSEEPAVFEAEGGDWEYCTTLGESGIITAAETGEYRGIFRMEAGEGTGTLTVTKEDGDQVYTVRPGEEVCLWLEVGDSLTLSDRNFQVKSYMDLYSREEQKS